jgi:hypothetical protein
MKKLKSLDEFESPSATPLTEEVFTFLDTVAKSVEAAATLQSAVEPLTEQDTKKLPEKTKFRFEISDQLKKVAKIQKTLIDLAQMLTEMSDTIVALKLNFPNMDPQDLTIVNNLKYNIDNMLAALRRDKKSGTRTGVIDNSKRMQRNLEHLKKDFLHRSGLK